jgi:hypothetical protein
VGWFLRDALWQVGLLLGLGLMAFAGYRLDDHHGGPGAFVLALAGAVATVRSVLRAGRGRRGGPRG